MNPIPWHAVGAVALPNIGGFLSGYVSGRGGSYEQWYDSLKKPDWKPPNKAFPIVWTALYSGMGYASYLVFKEGGGINGTTKLPLAMYGAQLAVNFAWSPIFFGQRSIKGGLITITILDTLVLGTTYLFFKVSRPASYLMVPYITWLALATTLNYRVWKDNPAIAEAKEE